MRVRITVIKAYPAKVWRHSILKNRAVDIPPTGEGCFQKAQPEYELLLFCGFGMLPDTRSNKDVSCHSYAMVEE